MSTCISQRNVIVSMKGILLGIYFTISCIIAFAYFSEMMNYVIGSVGCKFSTAVWKELNLIMFERWLEKLLEAYFNPLVDAVATQEMTNKKGNLKSRSYTRHVNNVFHKDNLNHLLRNVVKWSHAL